VPPIDSLIPQSIIDQIVVLAQSMGRYYEVTAGDAIPADKPGISMKGAPDIYCNDSVITDLSNKWTITVSLVVNSWREIKP
jgi:hypothetical protein